LSEFPSLNRGGGFARGRIQRQVVKAVKIQLEPAGVGLHRAFGESASPPKADIVSLPRYVSFVPNADSCTAANDAHGLAIRTPHQHGRAASLAPRGRAPSAFAVLRSMTSSNLLD